MHQETGLRSIAATAKASHAGRSQIAKLQTALQSRTHDRLAAIFPAPGDTLRVPRSPLPRFRPTCVFVHRVTEVLKLVVVMKIILSI